MVSEEEKQETVRGFKVEDRRRFSAEGELKPEHRGLDEVKEQSSAASQPSQTGGATADPAAAQTSPHKAQASAKPSRAAPEINFGAFVVGLSTQALVHLGEIPDPHTNQPAQDLVAAQQLIDIVAMLETKTRGNLDQNEQALLQSILYELRMKYVERARQ